MYNHIIGTYMASTRNTDRVRYRYGICLNDNCEKCKSKEVQIIPARKDFVCQNPECGKPLRECPPPKQRGTKKIIGIIVSLVVVITIIGAVFYMAQSDNDNTQSPKTAIDTTSIKAPVEKAAPAEKDTVIITDTIVQRDTVKVEVPTKPKESNPKPVSVSNSKDLGYATFKGTWPNDVNGRMVFRTQHLIESRDPKGRVAEAGDYVIGEWSEGHLVQGIWYGSDNQVKGSIIIGK